MRTARDAPLPYWRFYGPERLCQWCAELADGCSCKGGLTRQRAAFCMGSAHLWREPNPEASRTPNRSDLLGVRPKEPQPVLRGPTPRGKLVEAWRIVNPIPDGRKITDSIPNGRPTADYYGSIEFWCSWCQRMRTAHVCGGPALTRHVVETSFKPK